MNLLRQFAERSPVITYILLCYLITWSVWFSIPDLAGTEWTLIKIWTGAGLGPGLAAVLLDRLRRGLSARDFTRGWWIAFTVVAVVVFAIDLWSLLGGDGISIAAIPGSEPLGLSVSGVTGALISAGVAGFTFAMARASTSATLNSIASLRGSLHWWLIALLLPTVVYVAGVGAMILSGGEVGDPPLMGTDLSVTLPLLVRAALFTYLVVCVGEETGWRGYMLPELQKRFSPLVASLCIGVVWGVWHMPLWLAGLYPGDVVTGTLFYILFCSTLAIVFTWIFNRTGGILSLMLVLHMSINTTNKVLPGTWWAGVFLALLALWLVYRERMWRRVSPGVETREYA